MKRKIPSRITFLFAEQIRTRLRAQFNGAIPYSSITIGKSINEVVSLGVALCNDLHLKKQLKKQTVTGKRELGQFCNQFGTYVVHIPYPAQKTPQKRFQAPKRTKVTADLKGKGKSLVNRYT